MNPVVVSFNTLREIVVDIIDECMSHERPFEFADKVFAFFLWRTVKSAVLPLSVTTNFL